MRVSTALAVIALVAVLGTAEGVNLKTMSCPGIGEINKMEPQKREETCLSSACNHNFCLNMEWDASQSKYKQIQLVHAEPCSRFAMSCESAFGVRLAIDRDTTAEKVLSKVTEARKKESAEKQAAVDVKQLAAVRASSCNERSLHAIANVDGLSEREKACLDCGKAWCLEVKEGDEGWVEVAGDERKVSAKNNVCVESVKDCKIVYTEQKEEKTEGLAEGVGAAMGKLFNKASAYWNDMPEHGVSFGIRFDPTSTDDRSAITVKKIAELNKAKKEHDKHNKKPAESSRELPAGGHGTEGGGKKKADLTCDGKSLDDVNALEDKLERRNKCLGCDFAWCSNIAFHDHAFSLVPIGEHSEHTLTELADKHDVCAEHRKDCGESHSMPLGVKFVEKYEDMTVDELVQHRITRLQAKVPAAPAEAGDDASEHSQEEAPAAAPAEAGDDASEHSAAAPPAVEKIEEECHMKMPGMDDGTAQDACSKYVNNLAVFANSDRKVFIPVGDKCVEQVVSTNDDKISVDWKYVEDKSLCSGAAEKYPSCSNEEAETEENAAMCKYLKSDIAQGVFAVFSCEIGKGKNGQQIMDTCKLVGEAQHAAAGDASEKSDDAEHEKNGNETKDGEKHESAAKEESAAKDGAHDDGEFEH